MLFCRWLDEHPDVEPRQLEPAHVSIRNGSDRRQSKDDASSSEKTSDEDEEVVFRCPCGREFKRRTPYQRHMDVAHSNAESHKCKICGKTFGNVNTLTMHMSVHDETPGFTKTVERCTKNGAKRAVSSIKPPSRIQVVESTPSVTPGDKVNKISSIVLRVSKRATSSEDEAGGTDKENDGPQGEAEFPSLGCGPDQSSSKQPSPPGLDIKGSIITLNAEKITEIFRMNGTQLENGFSALQSGFPTSAHSVIVIKTEPRDVTPSPQACDQGIGSVNSVLATDDASVVRKSQRLQGKIPGWKTLMHEDNGEQRNRKRKLAKVKSEEESSVEALLASASLDMQSLLLPPKHAYADMGGPRMPGDVEIDSHTDKTASSGSNYQCLVCSKEFLSEKYLTMHMALHKVDNTMASLMSQNKDPDSEEIIPIVPVTMAGPNGSFWTCKICNKSFAQNSNYKNHIRTHSDERPFVCDICSIGFKERYHLKKHMLFKHSNELKEECRVCGKKFKDSTAVRAHERIHSDIRPYSCRRCSKSFKTSECLWHHENRSKTCGQALLGEPSPGPRFKRGRQAKREARQFTRPSQHVTIMPALSQAGPSLTLPNPQPNNPAHLNPSMPTDCIVPSSQMSNNITVLKTELVSTDTSVSLPNLVQASTPVQLPDTPQQPEPLPASTGAQFSNSVTVVSSPGTVLAGYNSQVPSLVKVEAEKPLPDYELTAMGADSSYDEACSAASALMEDYPATPSGGSMIDHENNLGELSSDDSLMNLNTECQDSPEAGEIGLDADIETQSLLAQNANGNEVSNGKARYSCEKCGKQFVNIGAFDKHLLTHSEIRPYKCSICDVGFKLKVHLKKHNLYRHSDEYPCQCRVCGKKFKDSSAVRLHERIHSEDRPFGCECGKRFKTRENLWGHRHRGPCEKAKPTFPDPVVSGPEQPSRPTSLLLPVVSTVSGQTPASDPLPQSVLESNGNLLVGDFVSSSSGPAGVTVSIKSVPCTSQSEESGTGHSVTRNADVIRVNLPVLTSPVTSGAGLPMAVVAPIKREATPLPPCSLPATHTITIPMPVKSERVDSPDAEKCVKTETGDQVLPPFETFSPTLRGMASPRQTEPSPTKPSIVSGDQTLAEKCPTIQKYLQMGRQPVKLPGIQQLFQSHSLSSGLVNGQFQSVLGRPVNPDYANQPLGPHPMSQSTSGSTNAISRSQRPVKLTEAPPTPERAGTVQARVSLLVPGIRAVSPYPGSGPQGLPLLFPTDPNLASASTQPLVLPSPQDPGPGLTSWDEDGEKKTVSFGGSSGQWQNEQEALFTDLSNSGFSQL